MIRLSANGRKCNKTQIFHKFHGSGRVSFATSYHKLPERDSCRESGERDRERSSERGIPSCMADNITGGQEETNEREEQMESEEEREGENEPATQ